MSAPRSSEERQMRALVESRLRARWPEARIIHELPLRYSERRIDMAAVTERELIAVEIKSSRDVIDRLEAQLRAFAPITTRLIVALAPRWNEKLPPLIRPHKRGGTAFVPQYTEAQSIIRRVGGDHVETWTVDAVAGTVERTDGGYTDQRHPWPALLLGILHVEELAQIAREHRAPHVARPTHRHLLEACLSVLTTGQALRATCRALRARAAFSAGTDPAIVAAAASPRGSLFTGPAP